MTNHYVFQYDEIKEKLEDQKNSLLQKLKDKTLTASEREAIQMSIDNYNYILDLVDMNHFGRGLPH